MYIQFSFDVDCMYICVIALRKRITITINRETMNIQTTIQTDRIAITEARIDDTYYIEQAIDNNRFYVLSKNGYNGYEGDGFAGLDEAIRSVKKTIKNYFVDRCEDNPKGF